MDVVIKILQFILSFSLLVFIHELGHFLSARMFGIRVDKFYIFFNPGFSLVKFKIGHTEYGIGWIPFGGYCKISGMIDESMDTDQMSQPPKPWEFRSKPAWQRLIVMLGGVIMNVVLAMIIYIGMSWSHGEKYIANDDLKYGYEFDALGQEMGFRNGDKILSINDRHYDDADKVFIKMFVKSSPDVEVLRGGQTIRVKVSKEFVGRKLESPGFMSPRIPFVIDSVASEGGAAHAGLLKGDSLVAFDGVPLMFFDEYRKVFEAAAGTTSQLTIMRDSADVKVERTLPVEISDEGKIGTYPKSLLAFVPLTVKNYNLWQSIPVGIRRTGSEIADYWDQFKLIFTPGTKAIKQLGGPISIGNIFPKTWDWVKFWRITAFLSIVLAVMNVLPVPGLDGGHVMFVLYEMITGRKPGDKFLEYAITAGFLLLFGLIIFATWNDIYRLFIN